MKKPMTTTLKKVGKNFVTTCMEEKKDPPAHALTFHQKLNNNYYHVVGELEFQKDLFSYYGMTDNPKKELAYHLAYDYGRCTGYKEIYKYFHDLVLLIR